MILLTNQKPLHSNHGAAHKGVFVKTLHRECRVTTGAGNRKDDLAPQLHAEHGYQRGRNIDFAGRNLRNIRTVSGKVAGKKAVTFLTGGQGNQLALAVGFLLPDCVVGKNNILCFYCRHLRQNANLANQRIHVGYIRHPGGQRTKPGPFHFAGDITPGIAPNGQHRPQRQRNQEQ